MGTPQQFYSVVPPTPFLSRSLLLVPLLCQSGEDASSFPHRSPGTPSGPRALSLSGRDTLRQPANLHESPADDLHLPKADILCECVFVRLVRVWIVCEGSHVFSCVHLWLFGIGTDVCVCLYACRMSVGVWSWGAVAADWEAWPTSHLYPGMLFSLRHYSWLRAKFES